MLKSEDRDVEVLLLLLLLFSAVEEAEEEEEVTLEVSRGLAYLRTHCFLCIKSGLEKKDTYSWLVEIGLEIVEVRQSNRKIKQNNFVCPLGT